LFIFFQGSSIIGGTSFLIFSRDVNSRAVDLVIIAIIIFVVIIVDTRLRDIVVDYQLFGDCLLGLLGS